MLHHRVSVAAAEGAAEFRLDSQGAADLGKMNCHRRVRFQMEGFNMEAVCERKLCPRLFDGGFKDMADIFQGLLNEFGFDVLILDADLVFTGEGYSDRLTLMG